MSFTGRLVHQLAIVAPDTGDPEDVDDLDEYGHVVVDASPSVTLVRGLVQPRTAKEVESAEQGGAEISTHVIFLLPRAIPGGAWIADADTVGVLAGGRRFDITGVRDFAFGRTPHLEVDVKLVGRTEDPALGS